MKSMDKITVINKCKELGCCDSCCLRFVGVKTHKAYEYSHEFINKFLKEIASEAISTETEIPNEQEKTINGQENLVEMTNLADPDSKPEKEKNEETNALESLTTKTEIPNEQEKTVNGQENLVEMENLADPDSKPEKEKSAETNATEHGIDRNGTSPPAKRKKSDICVCCLGILQESTWHEAIEMVKEQLEKKRYECESFACALSAPIANLLREKIITLHIKSVLESYEPKIITALKEAWKWSFGVKLESEVKKILVSGNNAPLLITVTIEYPDDLEELEILKTTSPKLFEMRRQQKKRFAIEFTRRSVEEALDELTVEALKQLSCSVPSARVKCVSVLSAHVPCYLAGRYIKLSRELPQTPWLVGGHRMMDSSVQEIIFEPIAKLFRMTPQDIESRLKLMSAGREDVDVRCLGEGRPFAIEIIDPYRTLTENELKNACEEISRTGKVIVKHIAYINKDDLALLKKGEESKTKCYEALCVKLTRSESDDKNAPITVTDVDIANINSYRNTQEAGTRVVIQQKTPIRVLHRRPLLTRTRRIHELSAEKVTVTGMDIANINSYSYCNTEEAGTRVVIQQKTPIRVLHRRPLLTRTRRIHELSAEKVTGHPNLFVVKVSTEAGTYIKEWVHGELGRSCPALGTAVGAHTDILALDVQAVNLPWPPVKS